MVRILLGSVISDTSIATVLARVDAQGAANVEDIGQRH